MKVKKLMSLSLTVLLVIMTFSLPVTASKGETGSYESKDEVIYAKLKANGAIENMYVVNSFQIKDQGYITDYGKYHEIRNLTNLVDIETSQDRNSFLADGEDFYYQGELGGKKLPWDIKITYLLNGEPTPPEQLPGKSGKLEIHIHTKENKTIDEVFFKNYLLQITLTFDPLIFEDLQAPKGTEANEGKNKLITFSVLPGQEETVITTARVKNLALEPIEISAIPANLALDDFDTDDMRRDIESLTDAIAQIHDGVTDLKGGVNELRDGTEQLKKGSAKFADGMKQINDSSGQLKKGSKQILDVLTMIDSSLDQMPELPEIDLEQLEQLPDILREIADRLLEFAKGLEGFIDAIDEIDSIDIPKEEIDEMIKAMKEAGIDDEVINNLILMYELAKDVAETIGDYPANLQAFLEEMAKNLRRSAKEMEENLDLLDQFEDIDGLQSGLGQLASQYHTFHKGLIAYTDGVDTLATEYEQVDDGLAELSEGTKDLADGVTELHKGTGELHDETKDLPDELKSEIEKMLEDFDFSDFKPTSFVSNKNKNIGVVQFVLRTERIELTEDDDQGEEEEAKKSLWQRFLDLFRRKK